MVQDSWLMVNGSGFMVNGEWLDFMESDKTYKPYKKKAATSKVEHKSKKGKLSKLMTMT